MNTSLSVDCADMSTAELEGEVRQFAANIAAQTCRWLLLIAELDRRRAWAVWGARSCADWLSWHCGVSPMTGREYLRVATALASLPKVTAAFGRGELSYAKVRAISRVAKADTEEELVGLARTATAAQLETMIRVLRGCTVSDNDEANRHHEQRRVALRDSDDGGLFVTGYVPPETAPVVRAALEGDCESLRAGLPEGTVLPVAQLRADALAAICESALTDGLAARPGSDRTLITVVASTEATTGADPNGECHIREGGPISRLTVRRLLCDAATVPVIENLDGEAVAVGRTQRTCSRRQRRALLRRSKRCRYPGCQHDRFVQIHHMEEWTDGGKTTLDNLIPLCWFHHRFVHEMGYEVEMRNGDVIVRKPNGEIVEAPALRATGGERYRVDVDGDAIRARGNNETYDLGCAIDGLIGLTTRVSAETPASVSAETGIVVNGG
jgi:hypothetical protein